MSTLKFVVPSGRNAAEANLTLKRYVRDAYYREHIKCYEIDEASASSNRDFQTLLTSGAVTIVTEAPAAPARGYTSADRAADDREFAADQNPWKTR